MTTLNYQTLDLLPENVQKPEYDRAEINTGIVHFGAGNFHRAHQAVYCDNLLNLGELNWGITGVSMRSATMRNNLKPQDFLYTQPTLGNTTEFRVIGAVQNILIAPKEPEKVIDVVAHKQTQLVTMTITEKGYCLNQGTIDQLHPAIMFDINAIESPQTIYGFLASALLKRFLEHQSPLTILCCDNINSGGEHLKNGVSLILSHHQSNQLTEQQISKFEQWCANNVSFAASMVDRVTPATDDKLIQHVAEVLKLDDASPVAAEPFSQWVIEDNFAGDKPSFDKVGAIFVKDIAPYERVKLRFLNASHSMLASLGYLAGDQYVHEALQRNALETFTEQALKLNVLPAIHVPDDVDGIDYINQVFARFHNDNLPYACLQVGTDSSQKIQQRWFPSIDEAIAKNKDASYLAFSLAAWTLYIRKALENDDLNDPLKNKFESYLSDDVSLDVEHFLTLAGAAQFNFYNNDSFMAQVKQCHRWICEQSIESAITQFLNSQ